MSYRKVTKADLAEGTGLSYRTLEGYCYGRNDMSSAKAYNIIEIEHFLNVDGRILTGSKSIEDFYNDEKDRLLAKKNEPNIVIELEVDYQGQNKTIEHLSRMMEVYNNIYQQTKESDTQTQDNKNI